MKFFKLTFLFSIVFLSQNSTSLKAKEPPPLFEQGESLTIEGNKRTQESYIRSVLQNCLWIWEQSNSNKPPEKEEKKLEDLDQKISFYKQSLII